MPVITKRNGKRLMVFGFIFFATGMFGMVLCSLYYRGIGIQNWGYTPVGAFFMSIWFIGPVVAALGIVVFFIGAKRWNSVCVDLMTLLKFDVRMKIDTLSEHLSLTKNDVVRAIYALRIAGEPIKIDQSSSEVEYIPLSEQLPSTKITSLMPRIRWTSFEKASFFLAIISILSSALFFFI